MSDFNRKAHWEDIYAKKKLSEVSWYQPNPASSLEFILSGNPSKADTKIIDIGGGDSFLIDRLVEQHFQQVYLLDISARAISRAKERLAQQAEKVVWIESDIINFAPQEQFDIWHDRAAFHFLINTEEVTRYVHLATASITENGRLIIGTFSKNGPTKCSGIDIVQYSSDELESLFQSNFELTETKTLLHKTPFDTTQEFVFCSFRKK